MINTDEEIHILTEQLKDLSIKIAVLAAKHQAAVATVNRFGEDLEQLRNQQHKATLQLGELERHKSGMYMWENIGDGG